MQQWSLLISHLSFIEDYFRYTFKYSSLGHMPLTLHLSQMLTPTQKPIQNSKLKENAF